MKKAFCCILSVLILSASLAGCSVNDDASDTANGSNKSYTTEGKETKLVPDEKLGGSLTVGWYMPQGTSESGGDYGDQLNATAKIFKELYPNVELIIERNQPDESSFAAYSDRQMTELMAGKGADLLWVSGRDNNKLMRCGALANMFDYFEKDKNFNIKDYNAGVFCAGQPEGTQYIVPAFYRFPLMLTTKGVVEKTGLDVSKFTDYVSSYKEIERMAQKYKDDSDIKTFFTHSNVAVTVPLYTGAKWIDYDKGTINLDLPEIKTGFEAIKNSFSQEYISPNFSGYAIASPADAFKNKKAIFHETAASPFLGAISVVREIEKNGDEPILFAWRNSKGKISATPDMELGVNNNSQNKQAAYNFIKIFINPAVQTNSDFWCHNVPVSNESVRIWLERQKEASRINSNDGKLIDLDTLNNEVIDLDPLTQEVIDQYTAILNDVEVEYLWYGLDYFRQAMLPYIQGAKTYEECIKEVQSALEIYVSE